MHGLRRPARQPRNRPTSCCSTARSSRSTRSPSLREALAIRDGKILGLGSTAEIRRLAGPATRVVELGGRTVIPGLIDSHLHAVRAALSLQHRGELDRRAVAARSAWRASATAAKRRPPGSWLIVAGGWNELQFAERRRPTQAELEAAAPNNPVYVQLGYGWVVMTDDGFAKLGVTHEADLPAGGTLERDGERLTGAIGGGQAAIIALFDRLPKPTFAEQVHGTHEFFRELNRLGLTGVVDPGGNNLFPADYQALFDVWRRGELTVRVAYSLNGQTAGGEFDELQNLTALTPMGFGDERLHFNGLGERITFAMNNNPEPTAEHKERYYEIVRWAAERGMAITMHWGPDSTIEHLLGDFRARESRGADRAAALVGRALERCVGSDAEAHERARRRLDGAGRDVLRRRRSRAPSRRRRGAPDPARRDGQPSRRRRSAAAPMRIGSRRTTRSRRCNGSSTARRSPARRFAAPRRRPTGSWR